MQIDLTKKELRTKTLTARLKPSVIRVLDKLRKETGRSYADIIELLVEAYANDKKRK